MCIGSLDSLGYAQSGELTKVKELLLREDNCYTRHTVSPTVWCVTLVVVALFVLLTPSVMLAYAGLGGYISEKLLGRSGGVDASLFLGDSADGPIVLGSEPIISTVSATSSASGETISATLSGNLSNLNGMPIADTWFVWGYTPAMVNTTATSTETTTGIKTADISGLSQTTIVYYQFRASTDGAVAGDTMSFTSAIGSGRGFMQSGLLLVIAATVIIFAFMFNINILFALTGTVIGILAFYIVKAMIESL